MSALIGLLAKLLGLGNGTSPVSGVLGIVNWAAMVPIIAIAWTHRDDVIDFRISLGALALGAAIALFILELNRRTEPKQ
jgi:hypothetical protein